MIDEPLEGMIARSAHRSVVYLWRIITYVYLIIIWPKRTVIGFNVLMVWYVDLTIDGTIPEMNKLF